MSTRRLATSSRKAFEVLRYQGIAAADGYAQISAIATSLGPEHALLFAEPAHDVTGASTDWYTAAEGDIRPFADLSPDEQERTQARVAELSDDIRELAEQLKNSQEGSKVIRGNVLALALRFPDTSHIYLVGSQPVVTCWGAAPAHAESAVPAGGLLQDPVPLAMAEPAPEPAPATAPPATKKGGALGKVSLFFFLFLLLLALLFFGAFILFAPKEYAPEYLRGHMPDWFTRWTPEDVHKYVPESLKKYLPDEFAGDASKDPESAEARTPSDQPASPLDDGKKEDDPQRELERLTRRLLERAKTDGQEPEPSVQTPPGETPNPAPTHLAPGERPARPMPVVVPTPYAEPEEPKPAVPAPVETPMQPAPEVPAPVETPAQPTPVVPAPVETPIQPAPAVPGQPAPMLPVPTEAPETPAPAVPNETPSEPAPMVPSPVETPTTPAPVVPDMMPTPVETPAQPAPAVPAPGAEPAKPMPMLIVPVPIVVPAPAEKPLRPEPAPGETPSIGDMLPTTPDPPPGTLPPDPTPMPRSVPRSSLDGALFAREAGATGYSGLVTGFRVVGVGEHCRGNEPFKVVAETHITRFASAGDPQYAPRRFERASVFHGKIDGCPAPDAVTHFSPTGRFSAPRRIV